MDSKLIIFLIGIPMALIGVAYREPKAYAEIISPILKKLTLVVFIVAAGMLVGGFMCWKYVSPYVEKSNLAAAKDAFNMVMAWSLGTQLFGVALAALDIGLYFLAEKAKAIKTDAHNSRKG